MDGWRFIYYPKSAPAHFNRGKMAATRCHRMLPAVFHMNTLTPIISLKPIGTLGNQRQTVRGAHTNSLTGWHNATISVPAAHRKIY